MNGLDPSTSAIAIVGMVCRVPGAAHPEIFWRNLCGAVESISRFTDEELLAAGVSPELLADPRHVRACGVPAGVDDFDARFFGFSRRDAEMMDPQHRQFLKCAWEAMEDAGYTPGGGDRRAGVFAGAGMNTHVFRLPHAEEDYLPSLSGYRLMLSNDKDFLCSRVAYKLGLRGPAVTIQTACSTSLVAVHMACQSLLLGECDMALAGGVSLRSPARSGYLYEDGLVFSPDGHCRAFDAEARGTVPSGGLGIVVLKRLDTALAAGDLIRAVIRGSAVNNDGSDRVAFTAPNVEAQADVIAEALSVAEVGPESISYVEAHGTGTPLGDPVEISALTQAFRRSTDRTQYCAVGSVKTNLGHLDAAAGVAGLIKTVLALQHHRIPPSLHLRAPNPQIDFAHSPFYVNRVLAQWPQPAHGVRRAGVSSFGMGGTNAHVIVEEAKGS